MSTAIERCACGKYVLERWVGTYGDHLGTHRRDSCINDDPLVPLTDSGQVNDLLNCIDTAAGQTTDPMCRVYLCEVLARYKRMLVPGPAPSEAPNDEARK